MKPTSFFRLASAYIDNLTLPSMSTGTMQRFMVGDADDDLLPDFESDGEFDDYVFGTLFFDRHRLWYMFHQFC